MLLRGTQPKQDARIFIVFLLCGQHCTHPPSLSSQKFQVNIFIKVHYGNELYVGSDMSHAY